MVVMIVNKLFTTQSDTVHQYKKLKKKIMQAY